MAIQADSVHQAEEAMRALLHGIVPDAEIRIKAELVYEILRLKKERGAVILGHNYMEPALYHTIPDFVGDSLELSRRAAETNAEPIIFCGVRFMAETAKILNPSKKVLLPAKEAGCSLASSITAEDIRALRARYPGVPVVAYVNTYADVKAEVDICCTSGNAANVVRSFQDNSIIFLPDEYLSQNVAHETGREIIFAPDPLPQDGKPRIIGWRGRCEVHEQFTVQDVKDVRSQFPDAVVMAHPECSPEVVAASDFAGSTSRMISFIKGASQKRFLLLTECSMGDNIAAEARDKEMLRLCSIRCPHMNHITLEDTLRALREDVTEITLPEDLMNRARRSLERMIAIS
jgi:quinolinate synthase